MMNGNTFKSSKNFLLNWNSLLFCILYIYTVFLSLSRCILEMMKHVREELGWYINESADFQKQRHCLYNLPKTSLLIYQSDAAFHFWQLPPLYWHWLHHWCLSIWKAVLSVHYVLNRQLFINYNCLQIRQSASGLSFGHVPGALLQLRWRLHV